MGGLHPRGLHTRRLGTPARWCLGSALAFAALSALLPTVQTPSPGISTLRAELAAGVQADPAQSVPAGAAGEACEHDHLAGVEHDCGTEAKNLLQRFERAIAATPGRVLEAVDVDGADAVRGEVSVGLEARAFAKLDALALEQGLRVVRRLPRMGQALLVATRDVSAEETKASLVALRASPGVRFAEPNRIVRVSGRPNDPMWQVPKQADPRLEAAWDLQVGSATVIVALLDTGVQTDHPDLRDRLLPGYDFVNRRAGAADDNGHGTAMAGLIAASGNNGVGASGVAYGCRLLPLKVADAAGNASVADVVAGVDEALARGARVINLSLGTRVPHPALEDAIARALAADVVVVAAAGNQPEHRSAYPAAYDEVLGVTSTTLDGDLICDGALASEIDLGAPGTERLTTLPGGVYGFVHGSSAAAAYASGVAALVRSEAPQLDRAQVAQLLRQSQTPIPALVKLSRVYRFGRLDPAVALQRARRADLRDLSLVSLEFQPSHPVAGSLVQARLEVENRSRQAANAVRVELVAGSLVLASRSLNLAAGERSLVRLSFTAPSSTQLLSARALNASSAGFEADDLRASQLVIAPSARPNLSVVSRQVRARSADELELSLRVVNRGTRARVARVSAATIDPQLNDLVSAAGATIAPTQALVLEPGIERTLRFVWRPRRPFALGVQRVRLAIAPVGGETALDDNLALADVILDDRGHLRGLNQASSDVDVILDAPWRVDPRRAYVPIQLFVASRGSLLPATRLRVTRVKVEVGDTPGGGTLLYEDTYGAPPNTAVPGAELVGPLGQVRPTLDAFEDTELLINGHHEILRLPRAAQQIPDTPRQSLHRYYDVALEWEQRRALLFGLDFVRRGTHRSVVRVRWAAEPLPRLSADDHYHDAHHHTIAEWNFGSPLDVFAPRKAYGGPLQMVFECAYAYGVIDTPTPQAAFMRLITTDHNCFNNRTIPDPDGANHRPPFGPQSPGAQPGKTQLEAYRTIFGDCAGEEVTFRQSIPQKLALHPVVDPILRMLPGLPLGAHMLTFRGEHVEGAWHGGNSIMPSPSNPSVNVDLVPLLADLAQQRPSGPGPFAYAAHPFSGMGWKDEHFDRSLGLDPAQRREDELHAGTREFLVKGLEWFNGRGVRRVPSSRVDFRDMNPWADADWIQGTPRWDVSIWEGLDNWHQMTARTLDYAFVRSPERKFVRKIFHAGGSDAHGDFNFNTARQATPINFQSTYHLGSTSWYDVRTYCFGRDKAGATPGERWLEALADGNSVVSDGPLVQVSLDAEGRFSGKDLSWHDTWVRAEDADGRIGGDGPLDGGFTALVRRGERGPVFGYRYTSNEEFGPVAALLIYKDEPGKPNPTRTRSRGTHIYEQPRAVGRLALSGRDQDLEQNLDPGAEGLVNTVTAFSFGAYTQADPDQADLDADGYRCWTNALYAVPYDVSMSVATIDTATHAIPAGGLVVEWTFDVSMDPSALQVEVQALDARGISPGSSAPALTALVPLGGAVSGWSDRAGVEASVLRLTNADPIPVSGATYPTPADVTFVVYTRDRPRDAAGNPLNRIAATFRAPASGTSATTAAPVTAAGGAPASGGGGGGGCSLTQDTAGGPLSTALLLLLPLLLCWRRRGVLRTA